MHTYTHSCEYVRTYLRLGGVLLRVVGPVTFREASIPTKTEKFLVLGTGTWRRKNDRNDVRLPRKLITVIDPTHTMYCALDVIVSMVEGVGYGRTVQRAQQVP